MGFVSECPWRRNPMAGKKHPVTSSNEKDHPGLETLCLFPKSNASCKWKNQWMRWKVILMMYQMMGTMARQMEQLTLQRPNMPNQGIKNDTNTHHPIACCEPPQEQTRRLHHKYPRNATLPFRPPDTCFKNPRFQQLDNSREEDSPFRHFAYDLHLPHTRRKEWQKWRKQRL